MILEKLTVITARQFLIYLPVDKKRFEVERNKFKLFSNDVLVTETGFEVEQPDKWFDKEYVTLHDFKTFEKYQGKGFAKLMLREIFDYVKHELGICTITLIVNKNNNKAVNLYFGSGFEIYMEYDDSYSLIKKIK